MILSNLNDYCYIFEPNILKVVCEDTTDPIKEVTLIFGGNGIELKRNCINSIAYFDLSVMFEAMFADSTFELDYTDVANDPFYKTGLMAISAADETTLYVNKSLRWGAYQFDEVNTNANFSFPFWEGMPLVVNSSKNHDNALLNAIPISGVKTFYVVASSQFTHTTKLSSTVVQTITYYPQTCPTDGHYLQWVDTHGQIWHYMFYKSKTYQIEKEVVTGEIIPYYPKSLNDSVFGRGKVLEKTKNRMFGCYQSVDEDIYQVVESILFSPIVKYWINNKWIEVKIKDNTVKPQRSGLVDIEFTVQLPTDFNQRR